MGYWLVFFSFLSWRKALLVYYFAHRGLGENCFTDDGFTWVFGAVREDYS